MIAAHTDAAEYYPALVSIYQNDKGVTILVRSPAKVSAGGNQAHGDIAEIVLSEDDFGQLLKDASEKFHACQPDPNQMDLKLT